MNGFAVLVTLRWSDDRVEQILVDEERFVIGRSSENEVVVTDPRVSRRHLGVLVEKGHLYLKDLGSSIGSTIGDQVVPVEDIRLYREGEVIRLGDVDLEIWLQLLTKKIDAKKLHNEGLADDQVERIENLIASVHTQIHESEKKATHLAQRIFDQKKSDGEFLLQEAQQAAKKLQDEAQELSKKLVDEANAYHKKVMESATTQAESAVAEIHLSAKKNLKESQELAASLLAEAEKKSAEILEKSRQESELLRTESRNLQESAKRREIEATAQADQILREAMGKVELQQRQKKEETQKEVERLLYEARTKADDISKKAQQMATETMESTRKLAQAQVDQMSAQALQEAQQMADHLRAELEKKYQDRQNELELWKKNVEGDLKIEKENWYTEQTVRSQLQEENWAHQKKRHEGEIHRLVEQQKVEEEKIYSLSQETKTVQSALEDLRKKITLGEENLNKLNLEFEDTAKKHNLEKKQSEELKTQIQTFESEFQHLQKIVADRQRESANLSEQIKNLENVKLQEQNSLSIALEANQKKLEEKLSEQHKKIEEDINSLRLRRHEELDKEIQASVRQFYQRKDKVISLLAQDFTSLYVNWTTSSPSRAMSSDALNNSIQEIVSRIFEDNFIEMTNFPNKDVRIEVHALAKKRKSFFKKFFLVLTSSTAAALLVATMLGYHPSRWLSILNDRGETAMEIYGREQREKEMQKKFTPEQTSQWKTSYTDNLVYTLHYAEAQKDSQLEKEWINHLHRVFVKDLSLEDDVLAKVVGIERSMISQLDMEKQLIHPDFVDLGLKKMRAIEEEGQTRLSEALMSKKNLERFHHEVKSFWTQALEKRFPASQH